MIGAIVSVVIAGCGSAGAHAHRQPTTTTSAHRQLTTTTSAHLRTTPGTLTVPSPPPTGIPASPAAVAVIRSWSDALRHGDVAAAARYFAVPSVMINGVVAGGNVAVFKIHNAAQARYANETLPCGAKLISTDMRGQTSTRCSSSPDGLARRVELRRWRRPDGPYELRGSGRGRILAWIVRRATPATTAAARPAPSHRGRASICVGIRAKSTDTCRAHLHPERDAGSAAARTDAGDAGA